MTVGYLESKNVRGQAQNSTISGGLEKRPRRVPHVKLGLPGLGARERAGDSSSARNRSVSSAVRLTASTSCVKSRHMVTRDTVVPCITRLGAMKCAVSVVAKRCSRGHALVLPFYPLDGQPRSSRSPQSRAKSSTPMKCWRDRWPCRPPPPIWTGLTPPAGPKPRLKKCRANKPVLTFP